jgi:hypothetical protein
MPIIYWTGSVSSSLPTMIRDDERTVVVDKTHGTVPFERALAWAFDVPAAG